MLKVGYIMKTGKQIILDRPNADIRNFNTHTKRIRKGSTLLFEPCEFGGNK